MAIGLSQDAGGAFPQNGTGISINGSNTVVRPDKGFTLNTKPRINTAKFGDGYEQRQIRGINNLSQDFSLNFNNRIKEEIDDLEAFVEGLAGVSPLRFTIPNDNGGAGTDDDNETTIKVVCDDWKKIHNYGDFYSLSMKLRRIYEA